LAGENALPRAAQQPVKTNGYNVDCYGFMTNIYDDSQDCGKLDATGYTVTIGETNDSTTSLLVNNVASGGPSGSLWTLIKGSTFDGTGWADISYSQFTPSDNMVYGSTATTEYVARAV
jgi:hypothetical protein